MHIGNLEKLILDFLYDGVLIADKNCMVKYVNPAYIRITQVNPKDILGENLSIARPGARLPYVIKTGKKLLGVHRKVGDIEYIVNMVPIIEDNEILGGISIVNEINDVYKLAEQLKQSNKTIKKLETHMKSINKARYTFEDIVSVDEKSLDTKNLALRVAKRDTNVLIMGESGTGKELYAHSIHNSSERRDGPFVAVNCATFDRNLLESELFGYEEGAFTGAKKGGKVGLFELADTGTLFLDEIGEMDYALQAKLLRVLQENVIRRIGSTQEISIDVRIIAATNRNMKKMVEENKFRQDLYYRIAVFPIIIPPLRERREDIIPLIDVFINDLANKFKRSINISREAIKLLYSYDWPGNTRELKNAIEFAANMTDDYIIRTNNLPKSIQVEGINKNLIELKPLEEIVREAEIDAIKKAIYTYGDTVEGKKKAAEKLGISLATLYNKLK